MDNPLVNGLTGPAVNHYANRCSVGKLLRSLEGKEQAAFADALDRVAQNLRGNSISGHTARWLSDTMSQFGFHISPYMIRRHCREDCSCES